MEDKKIFGQFIRQERRRLKIKISDVCTHMGWSKSYLMDIESGRSAPPKVEKIERLAALFYNNHVLSFSHGISKLVLMALKSNNQATIPLADKSEGYLKMLAEIMVNGGNIDGWNVRYREPIDYYKKYEKIMGQKG